MQVTCCQKCSINKHVAEIFQVLVPKNDSVKAKEHCNQQGRKLYKKNLVAEHEHVKSVWSCLSS